jgi:hypothetical protein
MNITFLVSFEEARREMVSDGEAGFKLNVID